MVVPLTSGVTFAVPTLTAPRRSPPSNPLQEKSKVEPRKTSGGWSSCSVMPCRSQMFCSRKSQRYRSASGERFR